MAKTRHSIIDICYLKHEAFKIKKNKIKVAFGESKIDDSNRVVGTTNIELV